MKTELDVTRADAPKADESSAAHASQGAKADVFAMGGGFAALFIISVAADFLTASLGDAYHRIQPVTTIYRAILIATLLVWLIAWLGFALCDRLRPRWKRVAWLVPFTFLPWLVCRDLSSAFFWPRAVHVSSLAMPWAPAVTACLFLALLFLRPGILDRCILGARAAYVIAAFSLLVILPKVARHAFGSGPLEHSSFQRASGDSATPTASRVVWIVMDELSYDQTFDHRQPDLALPNFDALSKTSVVFSAIQPVGRMTQELLPALFLGKPILDLRMSYRSLPSYQSTAHGPWERFDQYDTIFGDAHALGWSSGVVGWYNPYCRLLPDVLNRCFWQYSDASRTRLSHPISSTNTTVQNLAAIFPSPLVYRIFNIPLPDSSSPQQRDYTDVMRESLDLLRDSQIRFVFLHLPVPHPPGIYNRVRQTMRQGGSYLDNLALADRSLGALRNCIESTPSASNTTLIVSSDHSWRTFLWKPMGIWSPEDQRASKGKFDPRPVLMVHLPGATKAQTITQPTSELVVHSILEATLQGHLHSPADLETVVQQQARQSAHPHTGS